MMRWVIVAGFVGCFVAFMHVVSAYDYDVRPTYPDITPRDGKFDAGTMFNPYVVTPPGGGLPYGEIRTQYPDIRQNDGVFDAGSWSNPYVYHPND